MRSIDEYDYEVSARKERKRFKLTVNFKKIYMMNNLLFEDNSDWDDKYPKNILYTMLAGIWLGMTVLFGFSNGILLIVTLPFMFFYFLALRSTYKTWKEYKYNRAAFIFMNIGLLILAAAVGIGAQTLVLRYML